MNEDIFHDISLEKIIGREFDLQLDIIEVIARDVTVGITAKGTVFKTPQNTHYLYITSQGGLNFGDVKRIVRSMGLEPDTFLPPRGDTEYFRRIGIEKFKQMFPGKYLMGDDDTRYYETLAAYNPALVRLAKIKGEILGYTIATGQWHKVKPYAYTKMKVS